MRKVERIKRLEAKQGMGFVEDPFDADLDYVIKKLKKEINPLDGYMGGG